MSTESPSPGKFGLQDKKEEGEEVESKKKVLSGVGRLQCEDVRRSRAPLGYKEHVKGVAGRNECAPARKEKGESRPVEQGGHNY